MSEQPRSMTKLGAIREYFSTETRAVTFPELKALSREDTAALAEEAARLLGVAFIGEPASPAAQNQFSAA